MGRLLIWSLKDIKEVIEKCIQNKFDFIMFIEGNRGLGKSTLAYKLLCSLKVPFPFRPQRDLVYTREETLKHLATKKGGIIFSDEMINVAYNRDFWQEEQKTLLKALNMYRDSCNVFVGCIPKFVELDKQIQRLCKMRITVVRRGIALIQTQMPSIYSQDNWDIKNNQKIEAKWTARGGRNPQYGKLTTIRGIVNFSDLSHHQREEYEKIKEEKRGRVFGEYQDVTLLGNPEKIFYLNLLNQVVAGKLNSELLDTIATINGRDKEVIKRKLNIMLKEKGDKYRLRDYLMTEEQRNKRDRLGFLIQSSQQAFSMPEIVPKGMEDKKEKPMQEISDDDLNGVDSKRYNDVITSKRYNDVITSDNHVLQKQYKSSDDNNKLNEDDVEGEQDDIFGFEKP